MASIDGRTIRVLLRGNAQSPRQYQAIEPVNLTGSPTSLVAITFMNGGMTDLAASVRATDGTGTFVLLVATQSNDELRFLPSAPLQTGRRPSAIGAENFGEDATPDVVVANSADDTVTFYLATDSRFSTPLDPASVNAGPVALTIADFDADGKPDVVTADEIAGRMTLLRSSVAPSTPTATVTGTNTQTPTRTHTPTRTPIPSRTPHRHPNGNT